MLHFVTSGPNARVCNKCKLRRAKVIRVLSATMKLPLHVRFHSTTSPPGIQPPKSCACSHAICLSHPIWFGGERTLSNSSSFGIFPKRSSFRCSNTSVPSYCGYSAQRSSSGNNLAPSQERGGKIACYEMG
jgi:hypothetical protein